MPSVGQSNYSTENFDRIASEVYDESIPLHVIEHLTHRRAVLISRTTGRGRILDVGCGTGRLLSVLPSTHYERYGIDISKGMVQQAISRDPTLHCTRASATEIPFPENLFDVVFCAAVLHHLAEPNAVRTGIHEILRVTKRGGTAIIWDHNPRNPYWPILMARVPQDIGEERLIPVHEIQNAIQTSESGNRHHITWHQFTFTPDFTPAWALPTIALMERICEKVPVFRNISAHNVAIILKG